MDKHTFENISIIFVVGPPGSGKGTQCRRFAEQHGQYHFSVGDYLRELCDPSVPHEPDAFGGFDPNSLRQQLKARTLIEAGAMVAIIKHKLEMEQKNGHTRFIADGFPRSDDCAQMFEQEIGRPLSVWLFECREEVAMDRFIGRNREDGDNEATFEKRYAEYARNLAIIRARYQDLLEVIDTNGTKDEAWSALLAEVDGGSEDRPGRGANSSIEPS